MTKHESKLNPVSGFDFVWQPTEENIANSNLSSFMKKTGVQSIADLQQRSTDDVEWFTENVLQFLDIQFQHPYSKILDVSRGIALPRWCVNGKLNIVQNCIHKWLQNPTTALQTAVISETEEGDVSSLSYQELATEVNRCSNALRSLGITKGDVVALYMPMTIEIVVALFAIASIGAIVLPLFSGFGPVAIRDRLNDAEAKALFTASTAKRRGRTITLKKTVDEALKEVPSVRHVIVVRRSGRPSVDQTKMDVKRDHWWDELVAGQSEKNKLAQTDAEDVLMLIYTSGTTGKPKGVVHTHCGFPVKAAQDMCFGTDVHPGQVIHWVTDMGWMMGPWLVFGAALLGATCVLYDGSPDHPDPTRLWRLVESHRIEILGLSPTLVRTLIPHGDDAIGDCDLSSLRLFASTGEPWNPSPWTWLFERIGKKKLPIINYSGGTEISGGIVMSNPLQPLKATGFSGPCPGIAADVVDDDCTPLREGVGELVIRKPWIGMARGFWNNEERYLETYWSRWKDVWFHGDWATIDTDGTWYILGRSDDTINVGGKRLGPTDFESILVTHETVAEAGAIGVPDPIKGTTVICFCVLMPTITPDQKLKHTLLDKTAMELGKPMKPADIHFVSDLPKTRNSKLMRRIIRNAYLGEDLGDTSSLINPEAVTEIALLNKS